MVKPTLKILRCEHDMIFKLCLTILQHYETKGSIHCPIWRKCILRKSVQTSCNEFHEAFNVSDFVLVKEKNWFQKNKTV